VAGRALGRRAHAVARRVRPRLRQLARVLLHLWRRRLPVGVFLLPLVPRYARATSRCERRGTGAAGTAG
jgi:hypothetical protein